jgi:hypothetical protein
VLGELIVSSGAKGDQKEKSTLERGRIRALVTAGAGSVAVRTAVERLHEAARSPAVTHHSLLEMVKAAETGEDGELMSELIHSAHLYTISGVLVCHEDRMLAAMLRTLLEAIDQALGKVLKRMLPPGADAVKMATAIRQGQLRTLNTSEVSFPVRKQGWLSSDASPAAKTAASKARAAVKPSLQRLWSALAYGLVTSHGRDKTMHYTLTEVYMRAELSGDGVAELLLGNMMAEFEDAWVSCHKGSGAIPVMADVMCSDEMREQLLCVSQTIMMAEHGLAAADTSGEVAALRAEMKKMAATVASSVAQSQAAYNKLAAASTGAAVPTAAQRDAAAKARTAAATAAAAARSAAAAKPAAAEPK